jgi:flavorubredoxin
LILGEKPILIDTVKAPFYEEMMERIASVIPPQNIKYIVSNHAEMDHSGSLPRALETIKPEKLFASKTALQTLQDHFHFQYPITAVNNQEVLTLGDTKLQFIETKMLHWPESMFTYCHNDKILFSQDGFGMHFATTNFFADQNEPGIIYHEAAKYFANILMPFSPLIGKTLNNFTHLNLDVKYIAPDHGPIWRNDQINFIIDSWKRWAEQRYYPKVIIVYDTMWGSTAMMAKAISDGIIEKKIEVKLMPLAENNRSDVALEVLEAGALLIGSPTLNQEMFPSVADILCYLRGLKPKNLIGQVFGSYGWGSSEATKAVTEQMQKMQVELIGETITARYVPTMEVLKNCRDLGINIAETLIKKLG